MQTVKNISRVAITKNEKTGSKVRSILESISPRLRMEIFEGFYMRPQRSPCFRLIGKTKKPKLSFFPNFNLELSLKILSFRKGTLEILSGVKFE